MKTFRQSEKLVNSTKKRSDNLQSWFDIHRKKLEEVDFVDQEFLHKKVNKNGVYMRIMVCYIRYSKRYM